MKTLEIYPDMTLMHLQQHFTELFPHLQLELVAEYPESDETLDGRTLYEIAGRGSDSGFLIEGGMRVVELENDFRACFGLTVRINRWSGYAWHDTDDTRHWTLDQQNQKGAEMSGQHSTPK